MNGLPLFGLSVLMSFVAFGIVTKIYIWPRLRMAQRSEALIALFAEQSKGCFEHAFTSWLVLALGLGGIRFFRGLRLHHKKLLALGTKSYHVTAGRWYGIVPMTL